MRTMACTLLLFALARSLPAQAPTSTLASWRRAEAVVERALAAHGGLEALRGVRTLRFDLEGYIHHPHQSRRADPPFDSTAWSASVVLDYAGNRAAFARRGEWVGGFAWSFRDLIVRDSTFNANLRDGFVAARAGGRVNAFGSVADRLVHQYLLDLAAAGGALRFEGRRAVGGRAVDVVAWSGRSWLFDARTGLLARVEAAAPDAYEGDVVQATEFAAYQDAGGLRLPGRRVVWRGTARQIDEWIRNLVVNGPVEDGDVTLPSHLAPVVPGAAEAWQEVTPNVWLVTNAAGTGYNVLVAAFADHALVVEAPGNAEAMATLLAAVERRTGRPVRYVVPTHHHSDHAGGLRGAIAAGATVVTTPGNARLFRAMATAHSRIAPDALARAPRPLVLDLITNGRRVFSDGATTIEILDIGPNPHTAEMLVAWVPAAGLIFQGDLANADGAGRIQAAQPTQRAFGAWLAASGLPARTMAGVHAPVTAVTDFQRHLAAPR